MPAYVEETRRLADEMMPVLGKCRLWDKGQTVAFVSWFLAALGERNRAKKPLA
jgi:hypothetical protein